MPSHYRVRISRAGTHYCDVIMGVKASQITSLTIVYSTVHSGKSKKTSNLRVTWLSAADQCTISHVTYIHIMISRILKYAINFVNNVISNFLGNEYCDASQPCPANVIFSANHLCWSLMANSLMAEWYVVVMGTGAPFANVTHLHLYMCASVWVRPEALFTNID